MNQIEFFEAIAMLEKEKGIPAEYMLERIENAILNAVKRDYGVSDNVIIEMNPEKGKFSVAIRKEICETVEDENTQITAEEAAKYSKKAKILDFVDIPLETSKLGRIAAKTAKDIIRQGIREAEKERILKEFQQKEQEIVSGKVLRIDPVRGSVTIEIGKNEAMLPKPEQIPGEEFREGQIVKVYIVEAIASERYPKIHISRAHAGFVKRLFEMEVPEIYDGVVEIKSIAREAGSRTKISVSSNDENVDAMGACIGPRQSRINRIVDEIGGEKIDIIKYSDVAEEYIAEALSPADVVLVKILDAEQRTCRAIVPDNQLSLAIGNKGQNVRLAARLTGYKIDIRSETEFAEGVEEVAKDSEEA